MQSLQLGTMHLTKCLPKKLYLRLRKNNLKLQIALSLFTQHQYEYSPNCSPYISNNADKENLFDNQVPHKLVIISFILVNLMFNV